MKVFEHRNPTACDPPGAFREILAHPCYTKSRSIEQATFKEHRFAFFYWYKWFKKLSKKKKNLIPPTLISIDYHLDMAVPQSFEQDELLELEDFSESDLANFCWSRMNSLNDGHILSAAFINIIGDIIVLHKKKAYEDVRVKKYVDNFGNSHSIFMFKDFDKFSEFILNYETSAIFFDIDLDYFISKVGNYMDEEGYKTMSSEKIKNIISPSQPYLKKIYNFLEGFTIATEQKHCGGIINSFKILSIIERQLFKDGKNWKIPRMSQSHRDIKRVRKNKT